MESAINDFQDWLLSFPPIEASYYAIFDDSGAVIAMLSEHSAKDIKNKILIDREIAESVIEGKTSLNSYMVDLTSATLEFIEIHALKKIDDVLHRVTNYKWSRVQFNDIFLTYNRKNKCLTIELSSRYSGTKVDSNEGQSKKIHWVDDTEMLFLFTYFNDPHCLDCSVSVKIQELVNNKKVIDNIDLPKNFSVYTRRLFKNYVVEEI